MRGKIRGKRTRCAILVRKKGKLQLVSLTREASAMDGRAKRANTFAFNIVEIGNASPLRQQYCSRRGTKRPPTENRAEPTAVKRNREGLEEEIKHC